MEGITARADASEKEYLGETVCARAENLPISLTESRIAVRKPTLPYFIPLFSIRKNKTAVEDGDIPGAPQPSLRDTLGSDENAMAHEQRSSSLLNVRTTCS